jgi:outer membrane lipoprotein carrier protein
MRSWIGYALALSPLLIGGAARADAPGAPQPAVKPATAAPVEVHSLDDLLARFAKIDGMRTRFREEKRIALLKKPLVSEGTIQFSRPGLLLRTAEKPERVSVLLDQSNLRMADPSGTHTIALAENPMVRSFVLTFVHVLSGDRAALEQQYALQFEEVPGAGWRLTLSPKAADLARIVKRAVIEGKGIDVARMTLEEGSGDSTVLTFHDTDLNVHYDAAERARIFRLP